ncbi:SDR family oxidoreductase [Zhongshania sp.]|uniref:SDR family oxidoreductase n=1 Tax=Zhongshania sp. TaxID=1971902 RepID=UPI0039E35E6C
MLTCQYSAVVNIIKTFAIGCGNLGVRCNAILPGLTNTKFFGALFTHEDIYSKATFKIRMRRHAEPNEIAGTVYT